ncbi:hypothetical protein [Streptomyces lydicus]|uniref:TPM domain-containing protein n=1 Tax=Streptomyces lydicus TaxID=47763 RepID=A0A1D7VU10_9ACTN|nr:hypothetical protein [Streptomyces lydicus]AOP50262.1 hypothetical protein SL103_31920 [Streptomyces lydicus]
MRAKIVLVAGWLAVLFCAGSVPAAEAASGVPDSPTQTAYLAEQLRKDPIYISDQLPREAPRSTAPEFAREARRLGVPTYVLVLPSSSFGAEPSAVLAGVHDRLGRKGLYVALGDTGISAVQTYGVSLTGAEDASRATLYELAYDATPREVFRHFVDVVTSGHAHQRAEQARAASEGDPDGPPSVHTDRTDRENQSFVTGIAVTGIPLTALLITVYALQRRRVRRAAATTTGPGEADRPSAAGAATARSGKKAGPARKGSGGAKKASGGRKGAGGPGPFPRERLLPLLAAAVLLGGLIAFTASQVFDDTSSGDGSRPTAADMRARIDRVADGLRRDPLYTDPESPPALDAAERAHLRRQLRTLNVPAVIAAVPSSTDDESGGDRELLAKALHTRLRRDLLIVLADPGSGSIDLVNYGTRVDDMYLIDRPRDLSYPRSSDPALGRRLDQLLTYVSKSPKAEAGHLPFEPPAAPDPVEEQALPGLFTGDFEPGLVIGTFLAGLLFGLVAAVCAVVRRISRRRRTAGARSPAPTEPSTAWLRRAARQELDALTAALEPVAALPEDARRRAWECLDAAALLIDGDSDGRIDADATPAALACAVVLARAGRAAIGDPDAARFVCHRNPLHGVAHKRVQVPSEGRGRARARARSMPVCEGCRVTPGPVLRLRPSGSARRGAHVPYATLPGPLAALGDGTEIDQLTRDVREYFGVH